MPVDQSGGAAARGCPLLPAAAAPRVPGSRAHCWLLCPPGSRQDMEHREGLAAMELVWRGSRSLEDADVFTGNFASGGAREGEGCCGRGRGAARAGHHALAGPACTGATQAASPPLLTHPTHQLCCAAPAPPPPGNYGPPEGFAYEWAAPPIMDDPLLDGWNVEERCGAWGGGRRRRCPVWGGARPAEGAQLLGVARSPVCTCPAQLLGCNLWACPPPPPTGPPPPCLPPAPCSVDAFVAQCAALANVTRGSDVMLTIGSDFQFANAHLQ